MLNKMRSSSKFKLTKSKILFLCLIILVGYASRFIYQHKVIERVWFNITHSKPISSSLNLADYYATLQAKPIGDAIGLSSLTYNSKTNTLFSISNNAPYLLELTLDGEIIRQIDLIGFVDTEALEYITDNRYVVLEEPFQALSIVEITEQTTTLAKDKDVLTSLTLGIELNNNKNFEGLAYQPEGHVIYVAKERDPIRLYKVDGFLDDDKHMVIKNNPEIDSGLFVKDLSGLEYTPYLGHLLVLSDESKLLLELNKQGEPISSLSLLKFQHGLKESIPQAEGVASDLDGNIYIMSEPNLFYVFKKRT